MSRLTVRHNLAGRPTRTDPGTDPALAGGWAPGAWLGAPATGGLALPSAAPSRSTLYSPRGVHLGPDLLAVADTGNHRVLLWHGRPEHDQQPADVVLGQPDDTTEGRAAGGRGPERGMNLPTGVLVHDGRLVVADAWHHRILVWDSVPDTDDVAPDLVLGQDGASATEPNAGGDCSAGTFYWPFGIAVVDGRFWVADTGNRRVLGWDGGIPEPGRPADVVLGQPTPADREENRGHGVGPASFRWPHAITGREGLLLVADAGNHRVLGWSPAPGADGPADFPIGQPGLDVGGEWPYAPQTATGLRFPYSACLDGGRLAVADTANNRVLVWDAVPTAGEPADHVLAQPDFASNGENRWAAVLHDTLCWPYGLSLDGDRMAVCDSGNNRVVLWHRGAGS